MKRLSLLLISLFILVSLTGCLRTAGNSTDSAANSAAAAAGPRELLVSAAASLQEALTAIEKEYRLKNPGCKVTFNFGGSGTLQKQLEEGAPADLFFSAGKSQMDALEEKNLLLPESRLDLLGNTLVLITGQNNTTVSTVQDLQDSAIEKIAVCTPESAPAGKYARESLLALNLWDALQAKLVWAKDVKQVLNYVETGNVEAGFLYQSDTLSSPLVKVAAVLPDSSHKPIVYPAAILAGAANKNDAENFLAYLQSPEAQEIFAGYGFKILPAS